MTDHITPQEAQDMLKPDEGYETNIEALFEYAPEALADFSERAARMVAGARRQWAVEVSMLGHVNPKWNPGEGNSHTSCPWVDDRSALDPLLERIKAAGMERDTYRVVSRLVIDLPEEGSMSNQEKARSIIEHTVLGRKTTATSTAHAIAQALADAGLLMPDLPEELPTKLDWNTLSWDKYGLDIRDEDDGGLIGINKDCFEQLALALLAHTRKGTV